MTNDVKKSESEGDSLNDIKNIFLSNHQLFSDMGFSAKELRKGYAEIAAPYNAMFSAKNGAMHRGVLVTLADTASGLAVFSRLGQFAPIATVDLRIDYADELCCGQGLEAHIYCDYLNRGAAHVYGEVVAVENNQRKQTVARVTGIFAVNTPGKSFNVSAQEKST